MMQKVGLTGSTGMIGQHMVKFLEQQKKACVCVTRAQWDLCEWKSYEELDALFEGAEAIFHFAAALPRRGGGGGECNAWTRDVFDANVRSCLNLAEWALLRSVPVVFLSSTTVYGDPHARSISEEAPKVVHGFGGFYGYSKLLAERVFDHFAAAGLKRIVIRPTSVYGYGLGDGNLVVNYLRAAQAGKAIAVEAPENRINFVHALDVCRAALAALEKSAWGVYNVAGAVCPSIRELAEAAIGACGNGSIQFDKSKKVKEGAPFIRFDLDCSSARKNFGFEPLIDLREGMVLMHGGQELP